MILEIRITIDDETGYVQKVENLTTGQEVEHDVDADLYRLHVTEVIEEDEGWSIETYIQNNEAW